MTASLLACAQQDLKFAQSAHSVAQIALPPIPHSLPVPSPVIDFVRESCGDLSAQRILLDKLCEVVSHHISSACTAATFREVKPTLHSSLCPNSSHHQTWIIVVTWLEGCPSNVVGKALRLMLECGSTFMSDAQALPPLMLLLFVNQLRWLGQRIDEVCGRMCDDLVWLEQLMQDAIDLIAGALCEDLQCFVLAFKGHRGPLVARARVIANQLRDLVHWNHRMAQTLLIGIVDDALEPLARIVIAKATQGADSQLNKSIELLLADLADIVGDVAEMPNFQTIARMCRG